MTDQPDDAPKWKRIGDVTASIRAAGIPDDPNRWIGMTPAWLLQWEERMKAGPKELALRAQRARPIVMKADDPHPPVKGQDPSPELAAMTAAAIGHPPLNAPPMASEDADRITTSAMVAAVDNPNKEKPVKQTAAKKKATPTKAAKPKKGTESKSDVVHRMLTSARGATRAELSKATGWPSVNLKVAAARSGLALREDGDRFRLVGAAK